jgi:hypothetical protein
VLHVVAGAASPGERAGSPAFRAAGGAEVVDARASAWIAAARGGDEAAFGELLAERGISWDEFRRSLRDVEVADVDALPEWATDVLHLLDPASGAGWEVEPFTVGEILSDDELRSLGATGEGSWSLNVAFAPLLAVAARRLHPAVNARPERVDPGVGRMFLAGLGRAWSNAAAQLFLHRVTADEVAAGHPGAAGDSVHAVFFGGGGDALDGWRRCLGVYPVLARILATTLRNWLSASTELMERVAADHALLAAAFGEPGPLARVSVGAGDVHDGGRAVAILDFAAGVRVVYKPKELRVAACYVELARALNDAGLDPPLHTRAVLSRPGYLWDEWVPAAPCSTPDELRRFYRRMGMHARLLQLTGANDFTTDNVVAHGEHPVLIDLETLLVPPFRAGAEPVDLPVRGGLLTAKVTGEVGRRAAELGALAAGDRRSPFKQATVRIDAAGAASVVYDYTDFPGNCALPTLNGEAVRPADHFAEVEAGYLAMADVLRRAAPEVDAVLARWAGARVRFLARDTHIYTRILQESVRPARLRGGVEREISLERLWRARFGHAAVVEAEVGSLRAMDVPMFAATLGSDALEMGRGSVPGFFDGDALDGARARLAKLAGRTPAEEVDALRATLFVSDPTWRAPAPAAAPADGGWLDAAARAGDSLLRAGRGGWTGLEYAPAHDAWRLGPLGTDLLTGTAGIGVVLADLYAATGDARYADGARPLLDGIDAAFATAPPGEFCGGLHGWGGWFHAARRASAALGEPERLDRAVEYALRTPVDPARSPADWIGGRSGLLAVLLGAPGDALRPRIEEIARPLAGTGWSRHPYPEDAELPRSLPGRKWGTALALARLDATLPLDLPAPETAGDLLARTALARHLPDAAAPADAARWLDAVEADAGSLRLLDAAEVALAAARLDGDTGRAHGFARRLLARDGDWFPELLAPDRYNLSAVHGVGAIVHLFTRLHAPDATASIRLLE